MFRFWAKSKHLAPGGDIQANWEYSDSNCRISLSGRITIDSSPDLHEVLLDKVQDSRSQTLTLDFAGVDYMDTSGVAMLVELLKAARSQGKTFRIERLQGRPLVLLEETQLRRLFNVDSDSTLEDGE